MTDQPTIHVHADDEFVGYHPAPDARVAAVRAELDERFEPAVPRTFAQRWLGPNAGGVVCLVLLPFCPLFHVPLLAWVVTTAIWLLNRVAHGAILRTVTGLPKTLAVGAAGVGMVLRLWGTALILFLVAADVQVGGAHFGADRRDLAVPAMVLLVLVFTVDLGVRTLTELRAITEARETSRTQGTPATR